MYKIILTNCTPFFIDNTSFMKIYKYRIVTQWTS